jgi:hypothetical protein
MRMKRGVSDGISREPTTAPHAPPRRIVGKNSPPVPPKFNVIPVDMTRNSSTATRTTTVPPPSRVNIWKPGPTACGAM